jgi:hypothetical protein
MAGIPRRVDSALSNRVISFLRRSLPRQLGPLDASEVMALVRETFSLSEKRIEEAAVRLVAEKSGGLPYLVQLLGYEVWESADGEVGPEQARAGLKRAEACVGSSLIELVLQDLSLTDRDFVFGLARSDVPAPVSDLMERTGFDRNKLNQYRRRLEKEGVVLSPRRGCVDFVVPFMRDCLIRRDEEH